MDACKLVFQDHFSFDMIDLIINDPNFTAELIECKDNEGKTALDHANEFWLSQVKEWQPFYDALAAKLQAAADAKRGK